MKHNETLSDEPGRLAALRRYNILNTPREQPFDKLTELVRRVIEVPIAAVSLIDGERQWFKAIAGLDACETSIEASFCALAIRRKEPLVVPDAMLDVRFATKSTVTGEPFVRSYLGIPLETPDGYNLGALCAIDIKPRTFSTDEIAIMKSFAKLVMNELELRQIAMRDELTGAMTRRGWVEAAERELARSLRHGLDAAIILFDIDHFKRVNDERGHPAGDEVLRALTRRCLATLRTGDVLGRIGGEEFAVLLPETDTSGAMDLAERLRRAFAEEPVTVADTTFSVTASFGVCSLKSRITGVDDWLAAADAVLYEAKDGGRNQCVSTPDPLPEAGDDREDDGLRPKRSYS